MRKNAPHNGLLLISSFLKSNKYNASTLLEIQDEAIKLILDIPT